MYVDSCACMTVKAGRLPSHPILETTRVTQLEALRHEQLGESNVMADPTADL